jgi:hypothetical protein
MAGAKQHDYHLVNPSVWPLIGSVAALVMFFGLVMAMHADYFGGAGKWVLGLGFMGVIATFFSWWSDVINEAHAGDHTPVVQLHLRYGMILFIASEVMFFVGWFWAWFDFSLFPVPVEIVDASRDQPVRAGWRDRRDNLAAEGHPCHRRLLAAAAQHADPALLGHHDHLGAPRADPRRP